MFDRSAATDYRVIDEWADGVGWLAHPEEDGRRASHALRAGDGVWLFDPLDAPGVDDLIDDIGEVAGVAVLSGYHARDAETFARRYDVPVSVPTWLDRAAERIDAPVRRVSGAVAGFETADIRPMWAWRECLAYRESDGTLYVPDYATAMSRFTVGGERVALGTPSRLGRPPETLTAVEPERILFGHGSGIFEDASAALRESLDGATRRFPRALVTNGPTELRTVLDAVR